VEKERERKGGEGCLFLLASLEPAVEEGGSARRGAMVGASRHFFFHIKHCTQFCIAEHAGKLTEEPQMH